MGGRASLSEIAGRVQGCKHESDRGTALRARSTCQRKQQCDTHTPDTDLRTPDAVDHGLGRGTFSAPEVTVVKLVEPPAITGFDWGDAGIGAGGLLGLILVGLGGTLVVSHRRHSRLPPAR